MNHSKITSLIADDVGASRELLRQILLKLEVDVTAMVTDGAQALTKLKAQRFDIVFLDIDMPGRTGLEVLEQMSAHGPMPWVIMVSAHSTMDNFKAAIDQGAKGFVVKPYNMSKIKQVIERFEQERRG
jgi:CheY-like chemotaxis protein